MRRITRMEINMRCMFNALAVLSVTISCSFPALAQEKLIGEYEGKVKEVDGYSKQAGDACTVRIAKSDLYGGSVSFALTGVDEVLFEARKVSAALGAGGNEVKLITPAAGAGKDLEIVFMKLRPDGTPGYLKLTRGQPYQHTQRSISCANLNRK